MSDRVEIELGAVSRTADGIIVVDVFQEKATLTEANVREIVQATASLTDTTPVPVLSILRNVLQSTLEARQYSVSEEVTQLFSANAIVVESLLSRFIGNFFIKVYRPVVPSRLFNDQDEAIDWLRTYLLKS